jgi:hypothetical protein
MASKTRKTKVPYLGALPHLRVGTTWQIESVGEWTDRGGRITRVAPGVSAHVSEWDTLASRIDASPEPLCADVLVSSWTVGTTVAGIIDEYYSEQEQENR